MTTFMITVLILVILFSLGACSSSEQIVNQKNKASSEIQKNEKKKKVFESDFDISKDGHGVPVPSSFINKVKRIFGEGISVTTVHSFLQDEQEELVLSKSALSNLSEDDLYELDVKEFHTSFVFRGEKQLGIVRWITVDKKSILVVFSSKNKEAYISEIKSEDLSEKFLQQFVGKGIKDEIKLGKDIQNEDVKEKIAENITNAIRISLWTMQIEYNSK